MVNLNGKPLGNATNQFIRYTYALSASDLRGQGEGLNTVSVTFGPELRIDTGGRFTHSTSIDWAPVMMTSDPVCTTGPAGARCQNTFGFGIWKSVYLVSVAAGGAAVTQLIPHTFYAGGHPTSILSDASHAGFDIATRVELWSPGTTSGELSVQGSWPGAVAVVQQATLSAGTSEVTLDVPASQTTGARLWHPHGHGEQPLYTITATFTPSAGPAATPATAAAPAATTRRLGFRHVAMVTVNDTDPAVAAKAARTNGTGQLTMFFRPVHPPTKPRLCLCSAHS